MQNGNSLKPPMMAVIDTSTLATLMLSGVPMVILEACPDKDDDGPRIPGAKRLSPDSSASRMMSVVGTEDSALIVIYSARPLPSLSFRLHGRLTDLGYHNALVCADGIAGWLAAGNPVEHAWQDAPLLAPH